MEKSEKPSASLFGLTTLRLCAPALVAYVFATLLTDARFMADTSDYVDSIVARERGVYYNFWEFGHLIWRPLGWLLWQAAEPVARLFDAGADTRAGVTWLLVALNWVAGLLCVLLFNALAARLLPRRLWIASVATVALIFSHGFLNNAQIGSSYIPGLAFVLAGLYFMTGSDAQEGRRPWRTSLLAGASLAGAVCMWFLYVWSIPGVLLAPVLLFGMDRRRARLVVLTALVGGVSTALVYALALASLGIHTPAELKEWIAPSAHGNYTKGVTRMIFGVARSFIEMGNDGMLFKRYLLRDPFNSVSLFELARRSLWKFFFFYVFLFALLAATLTAGARGRRYLALLAAGGVPVVVFAIFFDGGAVERYLPLYPFLFLALAFTLESERVWSVFKWTAIAFVVVMTLGNASALSKFVLGRQQAAAVARVGELQARLRPHSRVFTVTWLDELVNFNRSFPFHPLNRDEDLKVYSLVTPGTSQVLQWREDLASLSFETWGRGGDIWISRRALSDRPQRDWNWVEGDDPNVHWRDFPAFFSQVELGETVGGEDGFMLLAPTPDNQRLLRAVLNEKAHGAR
ncbi:MAG TPA: hypothetical protein VK388_18335 [Pyrinomonadaceae bacterium]|nr:hypothetical protein [Pyrinomonadaceae bacterium]